MPPFDETAASDPISGHSVLIRAGLKANDDDTEKRMRYSDGREMMVGDEVLADGMSGVIVCDFDNRRFAEGHEEWDMATVEMLGDGTPSSGVMIDTVEAGLVHYTVDIGDIRLVSAKS